MSCAENFMMERIRNSSINLIGFFSCSNRFGLCQFPGFGNFMSYVIPAMVCPISRYNAHYGVPLLPHT